MLIMTAESDKHYIINVNILHLGIADIIYIDKYKHIED